MSCGYEHREELTTVRAVAGLMMHRETMLGRSRAMHMAGRRGAVYMGMRRTHRARAHMARVVAMVMMRPEMNHMRRARSAQRRRAGSMHTGDTDRQVHLHTSLHATSSHQQHRHGSQDKRFKRICLHKKKVLHN